MGGERGDLFSERGRRGGGMRRETCSLREGGGVGG